MWYASPTQLDDAIETWRSEPRRRELPQLGKLGLVAAVLLIATALVVISQSTFQHGDEGFHLLASQLINSGKQPYLDFFYQHTPFYIYSNALWMRMFGDSWRSAHFLSAVLTTATVGMIAGYVASRMPTLRWRYIWAAVAATFLGTNALVTDQALLGKPYALSIFLLFAAHLLTLRATTRGSRSAFWPGAAVTAGIGVSLLAAPAAPVLLGWLLWHAPKQDRWRMFLWFMSGAAVATIPLAVLAIEAPQQMWFDTFLYHLLWRPEGWVASHGGLKTVWIEWLSSTQGMVLLLLALIGVAFALTAQAGKEPRFESELRLAALLAVILAGCFCLTRPTFAQYFLLVAPYMAILATAGMFAVATRVCPGIHSVWFVGVLVGVFLFAGARSVRRHLLHPGKTWAETEQIADLINEVTPPQSPVYSSDGAIYFAARRIPPSGLENNYAFKVELPAERSKLLRIISQREINEAVARGKFEAAVAWSRLEAEKLNLDSNYIECRDFPGHFVYWQRRIEDATSIQ